MALSNADHLENLKRRADVIDGLETYLNACSRRGSTDEVAISTHAQAIRMYRRALSRTPVEVLFLYACELEQARRL